MPHCRAKTWWAALCEPLHGPWRCAQARGMHAMTTSGLLQLCHRTDPDDEMNLWMDFLSRCLIWERRMTGEAFMYKCIYGGILCITWKVVKPPITQPTSHHLRVAYNPSSCKSRAREKRWCRPLIGFADAHVSSPSRDQRIQNVEII